MDDFPTERELRETGIVIAQNVVKTGKLIGEGKLKHLLEEKQPSWKDPNNKTLGIDDYGRNLVLAELALNFGDSVIVYGEEEEETPGKRFAERNKIVAIVDPVDGTDLLARDFSNWCCAMIFFNPKQKKIICSVVGHASGDIYYANETGAFVRPRYAEAARNRDKKLYRDTSEDIPLRNAAFCYYGQKPKSFLSLAGHDQFCTTMKQFAEEAKDKKKVGIRVYNFGGNPMMVRIPSGAVDAVMAMGDTELHDIMPGAYIALQAGAVLTDLNGNDIDPITALTEPKKKLRYILSGSKALAAELKDIFATVP